MLARQMAALAEGREQPFGAFATLLRRLAGLREQRQIIAHRALGGIVERHQPLLVALAAHDQHALVVPRRGNRQRDQFGNAQAGGVKHFQQAGEARGAQPVGDRALGIVDAFARAWSSKPIDVG